LAAGLRLQNNNILVDICHSGNDGAVDSIDNGEFPGNKSGGGKPGEVIANGVSNE